MSLPRESPPETLCHTSFVLVLTNSLLPLNMWLPREDYISQSSLQLDVATWLSSGLWRVSRSIMWQLLETSLKRLHLPHLLLAAWCSYQGHRVGPQSMPAGMVEQWAGRSLGTWTLHGTAMPWVVYSRPFMWERNKHLLCSAIVKWQLLLQSNLVLMTNFCAF